jgi:hypothetical protein
LYINTEHLHKRPHFVLSRVWKVSNEAMMGMQCLKMYSWEDQFIKKMEGHRQEEVALLKKAAYLRAFSRAYMGAVPVLVR